MVDKLLPQNIDAEQGVLGSIIIDPEALDKVARFLRPDDFYRDAHRQIYASIVRVSAEESTPADFLTICDDLERKGQLEDVGGASYITSLINIVPTSGNIENYGRIVERCAMLRRLIHTAGKIAALAYEYEEPDVANALSQAEKLIFELSQRYLMGSRSDISMDELMAEYMAILEQRNKNRGIIVGVPTNYVDLDRMLGGFQRSDLVILAARPSMGKTQFALNLTRNAAKLGYNTGFFSLEMSREQLAQRFVAMQSGVEQQRLRTGWIEDEDWPVLVEASDTLAEMKVYIDDTPGLSLLQMRSRAREWVLERGVKMIVVDYLQLMVLGDNRKNENRVQEVSGISRGLKALARELNIPIIALSQLSRDLEKRQDKRPQMSDLRESGALEQDADVVMFIYRDEVYNPETEEKNIADIIVAKQRNGPIGESALYFDIAKGLFRTLEVSVSDE
jgi:replicative DNA helicase